MIVVLRGSAAGNTIIKNLQGFENLEGLLPRIFFWAVI